MKAQLPIAFCLALAVPLVAQEAGSSKNPTTVREGGESFDDLMAAQPKLLRISGTVDGSGRISFDRQGVRYEHKQWSPPSKMIFGGEPWPDLSRTPPSWSEVAGNLDLTRAWVARRRGRDVIALEQTPDGFDLYLCDSPNGSDEYEVTIAIPRR